MIISILTLFPEIFYPFLSSSIIGRAQKKKLVNINCINIRDFASDKHKSVDDKPFGGGVGMIMRVDVMVRAIESVNFNKQETVNSKQKRNFKQKVVLTDPKGIQFTQQKAREYSKLDQLVLICGHYEGVDDRISNFIDEKISIGDYILTGGELPGLIISDAVTRLIPGVLSKKEATENESFNKIGFLEPPAFTRPRSFRGFSVPEVLLSGNHSEIRKWKEDNSGKR